MRLNSLGNLLLGTTVSNGVGILQTAGNIVPSVNTTYNLGSISFQWNNVYSNKFITNGGSSSQFVRGDGTLLSDNNSYLSSISGLTNSFGFLSNNGFGGLSWNPLLSSYNSGAMLFSGTNSISYDVNNLYYNSSTSRVAIGSITSGNNLIQPMSSNTLPSPQVANSSSNANASPYNVFMGYPVTYGIQVWCSNFSSGLPAWISIDMGVVTTINSYALSVCFELYYSAPYNWQLQGSNDNSNWTSVDTRTSFTSLKLGFNL